jgi:hypothetical protein
MNRKSTTTTNHTFSNSARQFTLIIPPMPRLSANPSRVDRLVYDLKKEYGKLVTFLTKIDNIRNTVFYDYLIQQSFLKLFECIENVEAKRRDELINNANRQRLMGGHQQNAALSAGNHVGVERISDEKGFLNFFY